MVQKKRRYFKRKTPRVSKAVKSYVKKELEVVPEKKQYAYQVSPPTSIDGSGATRFGLSYGMVQGAASINRIGNSIKLHKISCSCRIKVNQATPTPECLRIVILRDHQTDGLAPALGEIFADTSAGNLVYSPYNITLRQAKQYSILYDKKVNLMVQGGAVNEAEWYNFSFTRNFGKHPPTINFYKDTSSPTFVGVQDNSWHLYFISASSTPADMIYQNMVITMDYTDM